MEHIQLRIPACLLPTYLPTCLPGTYLLRVVPLCVCSTRAKQQTETGRVVNHMSADVNQLMTFFYPFAAQLVTGPAMLIASITLLWFQIK